MGAPCDHSREGRIRKALTKLSILYSGALFRQQGSVPGSLCAPLACRSGSAEFWGYLLPSGKIEILFLKATRQALGLGRNFLCWLITAEFIPARTLLCIPVGREDWPIDLHVPLHISQPWESQFSVRAGRAVPTVPSCCHTTLHAHTAHCCAHHPSSFPCASSPAIFYQYSSKFFKINESSDLQIFSLSETSIKYLPVCSEKSQTIHPFDLLLLS